MTSALIMQVTALLTTTSGSSVHGPVINAVCYFFHAQLSRSCMHDFSKAFRVLFPVCSSS